jgi:DNA-binding Lrp family transcriptional regulator
MDLSPTDKRIINRLGGDLPVTPRPFKDLARDLGLEPEEVTAAVRRLAGAGILRRFGATLKHQNSGFAANGLVAWRVPGERVDEVGTALAAHRRITHCYQRRPHPNFDYNLYTMIHGATETEVRQIAADLAAQVGLADYIVLFSSAELKKTTMRYFRADGPAASDPGQ